MHALGWGYIYDESLRKCLSWLIDNERKAITLKSKYNHRLYS